MVLGMSDEQQRRELKKEVMVSIFPFYCCPLLIESPQMRRNSIPLEDYETA